MAFNSNLPNNIIFYLYYTVLITVKINMRFILLIDF